MTATSLTGARWARLDIDSGEVARIAARSGLSPIAARCMALRWGAAIDPTDGWLDPSLDALHDPNTSRFDAVSHFWGLIAGSVAGGMLFFSLDQIVNERGGFLRKTSTMISYFRRRRRERLDAMLRELCTVDLLRQLPPIEVLDICADPALDFLTVIVCIPASRRQNSQQEKAA